MYVRVQDQCAELLEIHPNTLRYNRDKLNQPYRRSKGVKR